MTRIAPQHGLPISGPSGTSAGRTRGSTHHASWRSDSNRRAARFSLGLVYPDLPGRSPLPRTTGPWPLAAAGLTVAAATAAVVLWRSAAKRAGRTGIGPAGLHLHCTSAVPPEVDEPVSVLIPVRHEPDPTVAAVRAALAQRGVGHLDIVVLDDGCPQETRAALRREFGDDPRVRILAAAPLPRGWSPRAHRSHQLAVAARGRVLIFTEPSAPLGPHAAASATALLRGEQLDLAVLDTGRPASASRAALNGQTAGTGTNTGTGTSAGRETTTDANHAASSAQNSAHADRAHSVRPANVWFHGVGFHGAGFHGAGFPGTGLHGAGFHGAGFLNGGVHPGRFTVAVDADAYWRFGGYHAVASDPDPLALLRTVRRASGRVAVADGRRVIPPAQLIAPLPPEDPQAEAEWDSLHNSRLSLSETARRVFAALVGARS